jgi:hypothetical protein
MPPAIAQSNRRNRYTTTPLTTILALDDRTSRQLRGTNRPSQARCERAFSGSSSERAWRSGAPR